MRGGRELIGEGGGVAVRGMVNGNSVIYNYFRSVSTSVTMGANIRVGMGIFDQWGWGYNGDLASRLLSFVGEKACRRVSECQQWSPLQVGGATSDTRSTS